MNDQEILKQRISNDFIYHPAENKADDFKMVRGLCKELAFVIADIVPEGRERALAITKLEEVMMWANAGIARKEPIA